MVFNTLFNIIFSYIMAASAPIHAFLEFLYPITRRQILDTCKLKEFADDNFKFDENGRKLSKHVGNTVGKGEIAHYKQFLLFPKIFKRLVSQRHQKVLLCGNGLTMTLHNILCKPLAVFPPNL